MSILKASLLLSLVALISCNTQFGVRECIQKLSGSQLLDICKTEDKDEFFSCTNGYYSMTLCLANNNCYEANPNQEMPYNCWHCWAQLEVESKLIKDFQSKIGSCAWGSNIQTAVFLIVGLLLALAF